LFTYVQDENSLLSKQNQHLKQSLEKVTLENKKLLEKNDANEEDLRKTAKTLALLETEKALLASRLKKSELGVEELYAELEYFFNKLKRREIPRYRRGNHEKR